jgi:transglutaminase-like putative cysteine protease
MRPPAIAPRAPAIAPPARPPAGPPHAVASGPALLRPQVARLIGFVALAGFGALRWAEIVRPASSDALLASVLAGAGAGALLSALARQRPGARVRVGATVLAAAVLLLVALAVSGVPGRLLGPRGWDDLTAGITQGLGAISTVRTPYGGLDEWTRIVLVLGGCALTAAAALLAFVPRRDGTFGFPAAAAVALGALYTIPVMQHDIELPWLAGLTFTLLLATFLWLERLQRRAVGLAMSVVAIAALAGYAAAPALDGERALLDYEELAQSLSPSATTQYRWDHSYGPLDWPRDGREILRVRARYRAYWKAVNLTAFDGVRWVRDPNQPLDRLEAAVLNPAWQQTIRVTLRALRTSQFVAAGSTLDIIDSPRTPRSNTPGTFETDDEPLRRGHAYRAIVYTPRPTPAQLRGAPTNLPFALPREYGVVRVPTAGRSGGANVLFSWWYEGATPTLIDAGRADPREVLAASPYGRVYDLARRLRATAQTPYEYVRAVERHLARFLYSETPRRSRLPLADFLLRDRAGYCQQFSGAMALLLRMGGVPARVASGFSPGSFDGERREYVVRDVDAHSWVEVFLPGLGWVTRDPTPADAPARTQISDVTVGAPDDPVTFGGSERALGRVPDAGVADLPAGPQADERGPSALAVAGAAVAVVGLALGAILLLRRRPSAGAPAEADLAELTRALRRSGRPPPPQLTLAALADRYAGTPAQDYVRTLAAMRYGYGARRPTRAQRAALRRELGAGLGPRGRLRAWWALPPNSTRRAAG